MSGLINLADNASGREGGWARWGSWGVWLKFRFLKTAPAGAPSSAIMASIDPPPTQLGSNIFMIVSEDSETIMHPYLQNSGQKISYFMRLDFNVFQITRLDLIWILNKVVLCFELG